MKDNKNMNRRSKMPGSNVENPGLLLKRLFQYIMKTYRFRLLLVIICIFISVLANVQGTMFTKPSLTSTYCRFSKPAHRISVR